MEERQDTIFIMPVTAVSPRHGKVKLCWECPTSGECGEVCRWMASEDCWDQVLTSEVETNPACNISGNTGSTVELVEGSAMQ